jgi:RNA polymerase sigma-54 factor
LRCGGCARHIDDDVESDIDSDIDADIDDYRGAAAMTTMEFRTEHRQSQTLSPRLQHAVRLLHMSSMDYAAVMQDTLGKNPFLEAEEGDESEPYTMPLDPTRAEVPLDFQNDTFDRDGGAEAEAATGFDEAGDGATEAGASSEESHDYGDGGDRDLWMADTGSGARRNEDGEFSALDLMTVQTSLNTHLHGQLNLMPLPERDLMLAQAIVESLDDDGYLRTPLEELLTVVELQPPATLAEMQIALKHVQALEPGVAARSVCECLQLQLPAIVCPEMRSLARSIVCDHMALLAARDVNGLARAHGKTAVEIEAVCDRIRRFEPRPGWRFGSSQVAYVVPDVIVRKHKGQWNAQLNPAVVPKVRLNQVYAQLFQRHRNAQNAELGAQLSEARWTLRNVEQRFSTILDVAQAIVRRQKNFLDYGPMAMRPLGLREIAEEVGVHESTVSRVTNNKYMSTPVGVIELKYFFSRVMVTASGGACSGTAIRGLIKDVIEAESAEQPLSDAEITRQLAQQGLVVARRTVTKYRQMLKIEAVDRRRRHAVPA